MSFRKKYRYSNLKIEIFINRFEAVAILDFKSNGVIFISFSLRNIHVIYHFHRQLIHHRQSVINYSKNISKSCYLKIFRYRIGTAIYLDV